MPSFWDKQKGLMYVASNYSFERGTHGGYENQHKEDIEKTVNEIVDKKIEMIVGNMKDEVYQRAVNDLLEALKVDIKSIVQIGT